MMKNESLGERAGILTGALSKTPVSVVHTSEMSEIAQIAQIL